MGELIDERVVRAYREARGWDQLTLARAAGVDPSVISRLERGLQEDLRVSVLVALARVLETSVESLLQGATPAVQSMSPQLTAVVAEVARLAPWEQRQVSLMLRGYLTGRTNDSRDGAA